jgi:hypothetical protein
MNASEHAPQKGITMKRVNVFVGLPDYCALKRYATQHGMTLAEIIRQAIAHFLRTIKE